MANLIEGATWEAGIYRIETSDPVIGGETGISNRQAKQLGNRTLYLKAITDQLKSGAFLDTVSNGGPILERQATNGDLNDILSQGLFYCLNATNAPATIGFLWVGYDAPECSQIFIAATAGDQNLYIRSRTGVAESATWATWRRLLTTDDEVNFVHRSEINPSDYNSLTTAGTFFVNSSGFISNAPLPGPDYKAILYVTTGTNYVSQIVINQTSDGIAAKIYMRFRKNGTWKPWTYCLNSDDQTALGSSISTVSNHLDDLTAALVGSILAFACPSAPAKWLECAGQAVSRTTYSALFARIGTTWGAGNGSTTFNLPNLRGEFIRGYDNGRGIDTGRTFATNQADEFKAHAHSTIFVTNQPNNTSAGTALASTGAGSASKSTNEIGGTETRPRNVAMMYCIFTGV